ncbi:MAG: T9SS type A sorting domain-containing protein [Bacteroidales bacterium]|nr:T9SS type A sorting domain-containing protein [Bacteroidales bacterium]
MKKTSLLLIAIFSLQLAYAQDNPDTKRTWHWYFGRMAGLDFSSGTAVADFNSASFGSPVGIISDTTGDLLMYTNDYYVFNKNHQQMPIGNVLATYDYSTQSIIVPKPGNPDLYYIFYYGAWGKYNVNGLMYSVVDMTLEGGLGNVILKDVIVMDSINYHLASIQHSNGHDIWLIVLKQFTNQFHSYLLTDNGLDTIPVISAAGQSYFYNVGFLDPSPDGTKLAATFNMYNNENKGVEIFDFDNTSGIVSNTIAFQTCPAGFHCNGAGVQFSPDGSKLYYIVIYNSNPGSYNNSTALYQANLSLRDSAQIVNSVVLIDSVLHEPYWQNLNIGATYDIQLASDKKIYLTKYPKPYVGVINYPNLAGLACEVIDSAVYIDNGTTKYCDFIFPSFPNYFMPQDPVVSANKYQDIDNNILIFPNPFTITATLQIKNYDEIKNFNIRYTICDIFGHEVYRSKIQNSETTICRKSLSNGVYFIKIFYGDNLYIKKILLTN